MDNILCHCTSNERHAFEVVVEMANAECFMFLDTIWPIQHVRNMPTCRLIYQAFAARKLGQRQVQASARKFQDFCIKMSSAWRDIQLIITYFRSWMGILILILICIIKSNCFSLHLRVSTADSARVPALTNPLPYMAQLTYLTYHCSCFCPHHRPRLSFLHEHILYHNVM